MRRWRRDRAFLSRATRVYLIVTTSLTVVLLFSGIFSFRRQVLAIRDLSLSNIRLQGEKVAFELERRIWQLADDCLRDPLTKQVLPSSEETRDPGQAQRTIADFATLAKRHPIAGRWFALQDGKATCLVPAARENLRSAGDADFAGVVERSFRFTGYYAPDRIYTQTIGGSPDIHEIFLNLSISE